MSVTTTTLCGLGGVNGLNSSSSSITCTGGPIIASNSIPGNVTSGNLSLGGGGLGLGTLFQACSRCSGVLILVAVVGIFVIIVVANRANPRSEWPAAQSVYYSPSRSSPWPPPSSGRRWWSSGW